MELQFHSGLWALWSCCLLGPWPTGSWCRGLECVGTLPQPLLVTCPDPEALEKWLGGVMPLPRERVQTPYWASQDEFLLLPECWVEEGSGPVASLFLDSHR